MRRGLKLAVGAAVLIAACKLLRHIPWFRAWFNSLMTRACPSHLPERVASGSKGWLWQKHDESKSSHSMRQACRKNKRTRPRKHTTTHVHTDTNLSEFEDSPTILTTAVALVKPVWSCIETRSEHLSCLSLWRRDCCKN